MTASAALTRAAGLGRTRAGIIPASAGLRTLATLAAAGEMAGDKMFFAPDRRIWPSVIVRLAIGAVGGAAFTGQGEPLIAASSLGAVGAVAGTLLGRTARGGTTRSRSDWARALAEDAAAAVLAASLVHWAGRRPGRNRSRPG